MRAVLFFHLVGLCSWEHVYEKSDTVASLIVTTMVDLLQCLLSRLMAGTCSLMHPSAQTIAKASRLCDLHVWGAGATLLKSQNCLLRCQRLRQASASWGLPHRPWLHWVTRLAPPSWRRRLAFPLFPGRAPASASTTNHAAAAFQGTSTTRWGPAFAAALLWALKDGTCTALHAC